MQKDISFSFSNNVLCSKSGTPLSILFKNVKCCRTLYENNKKYYLNFVFKNESLELLNEIQQQLLNEYFVIYPVHEEGQVMMKIPFRYKKFECIIERGTVFDIKENDICNIYSQGVLWELNGRKGITFKAVKIVCC